MVLIERIEMVIASANSITPFYLEKVQKLIKAGVKLDLQDKYGYTALIIAYRYSNNGSSPETVQELINAGAKLDIQEKQIIAPPTIDTYIPIRRKSSPIIIKEKEKDNPYDAFEPFKQLIQFQTLT